MPLYSFKCPHCGGRFDKILKLADYAAPQTCSCGATAEKVLTAPAIQTDYPGYECPVSGRWVEGRKAHKENLARTGCRILEPGETTAHKRGLSQDDERLDRAIEATAEEFVEKLPAQKREQLANEMAAGISATVERL